MLQIICIFAIIALVAGIWIYDHKTENNDDIEYERWKSENHIKEL